MAETATISPGVWAKNIIKPQERDKYLNGGKDFIDEDEIFKNIAENSNPDTARIREILQKSLAIERLEPEETAALLSVEDESLLNEMQETAKEVKKRVYDNRIVFFAPLYMSNYCVNNCSYCGFRCTNKAEQRKTLTTEEIKAETRAMVNEGHKRMISVYGEHPKSDINYMCDSLKAVYSVQEKAPNGPGYGSIRRINVNAPPMSIDELKQLKDVGIGTYQVFQETYHKPTYRRVHPSGPKADYRWRLYTMHRAMEAGIDDLGLGALFGLYDWKFEVMGLLYHSIDLENKFGIGPHTISFPRLMPASHAPESTNSRYSVPDDEFRKLVTVLRLAVPYTGLIITARERPEIRSEMLSYGCTQTDASTKIGIGDYSKNTAAKTTAANTEPFEYKQQEDNQQFLLGDTRSMNEMVKELAGKGVITSFCTAGYRCGRTGEKIMGLLKSGTEGKFCKLNAVLTYAEYLDDYATEETRKAGEKVIEQEFKEIEKDPFFMGGNLYNEFLNMYRKIRKGERDYYI